MSYREASTIAQVILAVFLLSAVVGMVYMAWQRNRERASNARPRNQAVRIRRNPLPKVRREEFSDEEYSRILPFLAVRGVSAELETVGQKREA